MPESETPGEAGFVLGLQSKSIDRVRLILRPSRRIALEQSGFDEYWGAELDVEVPVHYPDDG